MRTGRRLAIAAGAGGASGILTWVVLAGVSSPTALLVGMCLFGALWGLGAAALLLASEAAALTTIAALIVAAPLATGLGVLLNLPALGSLPALLCLIPALAIVRRADLRTGFPLDILTAGVVVFALLDLASQPIATPQSYVTALANGAIPIALFFAGALAHAHPMPAEITEPAFLARLASDERLRAFYLLLGSVLASAVLQATIAILATLFAGPTALPARATLPDTTSLAHLLGLALVLALTWDSKRLLWRTLLGVPPARIAAQWGRPLARTAIALAVPTALLVTACGLALTWSRWTIAATALALLWAAWQRRRIGMLPFVALAVLPFFLTLPHTTSGGLPSILSSLNQLAISSTLAAVFSVPALSALGIPASVALLSVLVVALSRVWATYRRLRPMSGEAGYVLAGGSTVLFLFLVSLTSNPFAEPVTGMIFWLFLGLLHATLTALHVPAAGQASAEALRSTPLRIAYLADGNAATESSAALLDLLTGLDRRQIAPLLVTFGTGQLADAARVLQTPVRAVSRVEPLGLRSGPGRRARDLVVRLHLARSTDVLVLVEHLLRAAAWLRDEARIVCAVLQLRPDLLVSTAPLLHVPALVAARIAGIPVQWHAREIAPARVQPLLEALVPWTAGIVADAQAVARSFPKSVIRAYIRVVRPGIAVHPATSPAARQSVKTLLGVADAWPLLVCPSTVSTESGHTDLLDAVPHLLTTYPHLRVLLLSEKLPGGDDTRVSGMESARLARLRQRIALSNLEGVVTVLGERADLRDILAAADLAVFPRASGSEGRGVLLALDSATPIVATSVGAATEELAEAWGYSFAPAHNPEGLAAALAEALADLSARRIAARRNPGIVRDWFSSATEAARLFTLYQSICLTRSEPIQFPRLTPREVRYPKAWRAALQAGIDD